MTDRMIFKEGRTKVTVPEFDESQWTLKIIGASLPVVDELPLLQMTSIVEFRRSTDNGLVEYVHARTFMERRIFPDLIKQNVPSVVLDTIRNSLHDFYQLETPHFRCGTGLN